MLKNYSKIKVDENGNKIYFNAKGKYHRLDGPAIEDSNGTKFWYINRKEHRNIGPSIEYGNGGSKYWLFKGKSHRVGGSYHSVYKCWHIHGKEYTKEEYFKKVWKI